MFVPAQLPKPPAAVIQTTTEIGNNSREFLTARTGTAVFTFRLAAASVPATATAADQSADNGDGSAPLDLIWD